MQLESCHKTWHHGHLEYIMQALLMSKNRLQTTGAFPDSQYLCVYSGLKRHINKVTQVAQVALLRCWPCQTLKGLCALKRRISAASQQAQASCDTRIPARADRPDQIWSKLKQIAINQWWRMENENLNTSEAYVDMSTWINIIVSKSHDFSGKADWMLWLVWLAWLWYDSLLPNLEHPYSAWVHRLQQPEPVQLQDMSETVSRFQEYRNCYLTTAHTFPESRL